jgi:hypothetical protein
MSYVNNSPLVLVDPSGWNDAPVPAAPTPVDPKELVPLVDGGDGTGEGHAKGPLRPAAPTQPATNDQTSGLSPSFMVTQLEAIWAPKLESLSDLGTRIEQTPLYGIMAMGSPLGAQAVDFLHIGEGVGEAVEAFENREKLGFLETQRRIRWGLFKDEARAALLVVPLAMKLPGVPRATGSVGTAVLAGEVGRVVYPRGHGAAGGGPRDLHAEAVAARDALAAELATGRHPPATVVGGYSPSSGRVTAGASRGGGLGCAEGVCSEALGHPPDIQFTPAVRPRTGQPVDVCPNCESTYGRGAFPDPATRFRTDRGGQ